MTKEFENGVDELDAQNHARFVDLCDDRDALMAFAQTVMRSYRGGTSRLIFEAFEQLSPELQQRIGLDGTGLGIMAPERP